MAALLLHAVTAVAATDRVVARGGAEAQQWGHASCVSSCSSWQRGGTSLRRTAIGARNQRAAVVVRASGEGVETEVEIKSTSQGDVLPSHEWPENFSLLNFEDLISHYEPALFKAEAQPGTFVAEIMSKTLFTAFPEQTLSEVIHFFDEVTGFPVVDKEFKVVGIISKKDRNRAGPGENPKVTEIMSSPAITLNADKTVQDAAVLMLKNKVHRIPIVNSSAQVVGIVTRTDIFTALDGQPLSP